MINFSRWLCSTQFTKLLSLLRDHKILGCLRLLHQCQMVANSFTTIEIVLNYYKYLVLHGVYICFFANLPYPSLLCGRLPGCHATLLWKGFFGAVAWHPERTLRRRLPLSTPTLVQSLNSVFFPPHIGAEPGRAKRRAQDNLHAHARNAVIFPPKSGEKIIFGSTFQIWLAVWFRWIIINKHQFLHSVRQKNMSVNA